LFKSLFNKAYTTANKEFYEETIPTTPDVHAREIYFEVIPSTPPVADTSVVKLWTTTAIRLTRDGTVPNNQSWVALGDGVGTGTPAPATTWSSGSGDVTKIMKNFISPKYGAGYTAQLYKGDPASGGQRIYDLDVMNWIFDFKAGVLTIESSSALAGSTWDGSAANGSKSLYIKVYQYVGQTITPGTIGGSLNLDGLSDVVVTNPTANNLLVYTGTEWDNKVGVLVEDKETLTGPGTIVGSDTKFVFNNLTLPILDDDQIKFFVNGMEQDKVNYTASLNTPTAGKLTITIPGVTFLTADDSITVKTSGLQYSNP
jgi:hypothetical protein